MSNAQLMNDVFSLPGFLWALRRHRIKVLLTFAVLFALAFLYTVTRGRDYESSAKLFVRIGRETVFVDPTAEVSGQDIKVTDTQDREILSLVSVLSNRDLLEQLVDELGPDTILDYSDPDQPPDEESRLGEAAGAVKKAIKAGLAACGLVEDVSDRERAILAVRNSLTIQAGESTSVIKVSARASSPKLAQLIVNKLLDLHLTYRLQAYSTPGSMPFITSQTERLRAELEATSSELVRLKNENSVASMDAKLKSLEQQMLSLDEKQTQAVADLAAARSTINALREQLSGESQLIPSNETTGMANSTKAEMRGELYRLQILESELLAKLKPTHPKVAEIQDQIKQARDVFENEEQQVQTTNSINAVHQQLRLNLMLEEARQAALDSQISSLDVAREELVKEIARINQGELELANLQRQAELLDVNYRHYVGSLEQMRITQELESNRISNVNVVQKPSLVEVPIGPSNLVILALGLIASVCGACSVAVLSELMSSQVTVIRGTEMRVPPQTQTPPQKPAPRTHELESVEA